MYIEKISQLHITIISERTYINFKISLMQPPTLKYFWTNKYQSNSNLTRSIFHFEGHTHQADTLSKCFREKSHTLLYISPVKYIFINMRLPTYTRNPESERARVYERIFTFCRCHFKCQYFVLWTTRFEKRKSKQNKWQLKNLTLLCIGAATSKRIKSIRTKVYIYTSV